MPRTAPIRSIMDIHVVGVDRAMANIGFWYYQTLSGVISVVRKTSERIADRSKKILRRGRFKAFKTGLLARSHKSKLVKTTVDEVVAEVLNDVYYSIFVHNGTRRMRKRPWLRAIMMMESERFVKRVADVYQKTQNLSPSSHKLHRTIALPNRKVSGTISFQSTF